MTSTLLYVLVYFILPTFYQNNHEKVLTDQLTNLYYEHIYDADEQIDIINEFIVEEDVYLSIFNADYSRVVSISSDNQLRTDLSLEEQLSAGGIANFKKLPTSKKSFVATPVMKVMIESDFYNISIIQESEIVDLLKDSINGIFPIFFMISLLLAIVSSVLVTHNFTTSILRLVKKSKRISELDFSEDIHVNSNDELGTLSETLDTLSQNLQEKIKYMELAYKKLERKEKNGRRFFASISHELKTPITILKGQNECMLYNVGDYSDHEKYLKINNDIIDNSEKIVKDMLSSLKIDELSNFIKIEHVNINEIINNNINFLDILYADKNITFSLTGEDINIDADVEYVNMMIKNIIENALRHSKSMSNVSIDITEQNIIFSSEYKFKEFEDLSDAFDAFITKSSVSDKKSGTGLGLYIIKKIAEAHNFTVSVKYEKEYFILIISFNKENDEKYLAS